MLTHWQIFNLQHGNMTTFFIVVQSLFTFAAAITGSPHIMILQQNNTVIYLLLLRHLVAKFKNLPVCKCKDRLYVLLLYSSTRKF